VVDDDDDDDDDNDDDGDDDDHGDEISLCYSGTCSTVVLSAARCFLQSGEFAQCSQRVGLHSKVITEQPSTPCCLSGGLHEAA